MPEFYKMLVLNYMDIDASTNLFHMEDLQKMRIKYIKFKFISVSEWHHHSRNKQKLMLNYELVVHVARHVAGCTKFVNIFITKSHTRNTMKKKITCVQYEFGFE